MSIRQTKRITRAEFHADPAKWLAASETKDIVVLQEDGSVSATLSSPLIPECPQCEEWEKQFDQLAKKLDSEEKFIAARTRT